MKKSWIAVWLVYIAGMIALGLSISHRKEEMSPVSIIMMLIAALCFGFYLYWRANYSRLKK